MRGIIKVEEISKIIRDLEMPIDDINFMPGERQVELRYKNTTIGYLICAETQGAMYYQTKDALTRKNINWHFIYRQNREVIDTKLSEVFKNAMASIAPAGFGLVNVRLTTPATTPIVMQCRFDGKAWSVSQLD